MTLHPPSPPSTTQVYPAGKSYKWDQSLLPSVPAFSHSCSDTRRARVTTGIRTDEMISRFSLGEGQLRQLPKFRPSSRSPTVLPEFPNEPLIPHALSDRVTRVHRAHPSNTVGGGGILLHGPTSPRSRVDLLTRHHQRMRGSQGELTSPTSPCPSRVRDDGGVNHVCEGTRCARKDSLRSPNT